MCTKHLVHIEAGVYVKIQQAFVLPDLIRKRDILDGQSPPTAQNDFRDFTGEFFALQLVKVWPDGATRHKDIYAPTKEECEALLKKAMTEMKAAINAERERMKNEAKASRLA